MPGRNLFCIIIDYSLMLYFIGKKVNVKFLLSICLSSGLEYFKISNRLIALIQKYNNMK